MQSRIQKAIRNGQSFAKGGGQSRIQKAIRNGQSVRHPEISGSGSPTEGGAFAEGGEQNSSSPDIVYRYRTGLYINLTNKCPTFCRFCVKLVWKTKFQDYNLNLKGREPTVEEVCKLIAENRKRKPFSEIVFCGYGEPTYRLEALVDICKTVKKSAPATRIRLNTVGLGSLIWGRDIVRSLEGNLDSVRISLNTADPAQWLELMRPRAEFEGRGYQNVVSFIRSCVKSIPETVVTAVEIPSVDLKACRKLAEKLGAAFQTRAFINVTTQ